MAFFLPWDFLAAFFLPPAFLDTLLLGAAALAGEAEPAAAGAATGAALFLMALDLWDFLAPDFLWALFATLPAAIEEH